MSIIPVNLIPNGNFDFWRLGAASSPDDWNLSGVGAVIAREGTIIRRGLYSAKVTRNGADASLYLNVCSHGHPLHYLQGNKYVFAGFAYATVANRVRLSLYDKDAHYSDYHPGDSTWKLLHVVIDADVSATELDPCCVVDTGDTSGYFSGMRLYEGESIFAFAKSPLDYGFHDRGDPSAVDYDHTTLTADGAWHDLDLSSIVPAGAKAVLLRVGGYDNTQNAIYFRKNGNSNAVNMGVWDNSVINVTYSHDIWVALDSNRVVEYIMTNVTWTSLTVVIAGYLM